MDNGSWCLIESDPGVFTELIRAFGVRATQVEEIYVLDEQTLQELKPVYGLIFLFKWQGGNESSRIAEDADLTKDEQVYFAKQVITNACATQAILSILLNSPEIELGENLSYFKEFTREFDPYDRGSAMTNSELIRTVHNSFARSDPFITESSGSNDNDEDLFHFISYVPVNGALYELDGLNVGPVNLGPCTDNNWLEKVTPVILERIARHSAAEIRFNLMAVIKNREQVYRERYEENERLLMRSSESGNEQEMLQLSQANDLLLQNIEAEKEKFRRYERENSLRKHNFIPLTYNLLRIMAERGELEARIVYARQEAEKRRQERAERKKKKGEAAR